MATKSQLKQYFETGKIPTQSQFGELIDFIQPLISDNVTDRPNQTLRFGSDGSQPIINGLRIIHYYDNSDTIFNLWLFTNEATGNNQSGISVPVFAILRITDENPGIPSGNDKLQYFIPESKHIQNWVSLGVDCDTASDDDIFNALQNWPFKDWPEGGGSSDNSNFKTCEIGTSKSAIFEVVEVLYNTERIKIPVSIRFLYISNPDIGTNSVWNLREGVNIEKVQNNWNNILANWEDSNIYDLVIEFRNDYFSSEGGL